MSGFRVLACILAIALVLVAGCSTAGSTSGSPFAPRPADVDLGRVPACTMLTDQQRSSLQLAEGSPGEGTVNGTRSPGCTWLGNGAFDYNGQYLFLDAALATTEPGSKVISVNGFGAVQSVPEQTFGGPPFCQVTVDAADGQSIRLQASTSSYGRQIGLDEQCRRAVEAASMVMTTVVEAASR